MIFQSKMDYELNSNKIIVKAVSKNSNNLVGKKIARHKNKKRIFDKYPKINYFNISSHFIYDQEDFFDYFNSLEQKNTIKLTKEEYLLFEKCIEDIEIKNQLKAEKNLFLYPKQF